MTATAQFTETLLKPESAWVPVDPATAARWLKQNTHNRRMRPAHVGNLARDMAAGNWRLTGEAIKFASDGALLDGQHRLAAVVKSGETVMMLVVRNLSPDAQTVMDTGNKRTAADALGLKKHENATLLAASVRLAILVENGSLAGNAYSPTHSEIAQWIDDNPSIRSACDVAGPIARKTDVPPAVVAYTYFRLAQIDVFEAAHFWTSAAEKVGLNTGDPVIALTNRFAEARRNRERLTRAAMISAVFRAWNARRTGRSLSFIRINSTAGGLVPVPEPK